MTPYVAVQPRLSNNGRELAHMGTRRISVARLNDAVDMAARIYAQHPDNILGRRRFREYVRARQYVMASLRGQGFSYSAIAEALGMEDHTSIIHGVRMHARRMGK